MLSQWLSVAQAAIAAHGNQRAPTRVERQAPSMTPGKSSFYFTVTAEASQSENPDKSGRPGRGGGFGRLVIPQAIATQSLAVEIVRRGRANNYSLARPHCAIMRTGREEIYGRSGWPPKQGVPR